MSARPPLPANLWDRLPPQARALILALRDRVRALEQQVQDLQERLNQSFTNSSRPPSTDPPTVKRRPPRPASDRPGGGQPGHERQQRPLLAPDHTEVLKPAQCKLFGRECTPEQPVGALMVSSEGSCAAYYNYEHRKAALVSPGV